MLPRGAWAGSGLATVTNALSELCNLPASTGWQIARYGAMPCDHGFRHSCVAVQYDTPPSPCSLHSRPRPTIQSPSNTSARSQLMRSCILTGLCIQKAGM